MNRSLLRSIPVRLRGRAPASDAAPGPSVPPVPTVGPYETACAAAAVQLRFEANGIVTSCCRTLQPLGHIGRDRLSDLWEGERRRSLEAALEAWDFSLGCQPCGAEIAAEGRGPSYAAIHDEFAGGLTSDPASREWPRRMDFNLSNVCNLQCVQCDGESSSSIRLHREHRAPMPRFYDDRFFDDLAAFLPHLERAAFAGGEPFMSPENFRVWDMIAALDPQPEVKVVTNATQWNRRVEEVLARIPFHVIVSLDGITAETYESIRIGADFGKVMHNVDRFRDYVAARGTTISVNHCLMPQNHHEFGDLLLWAEERDLFVNVSVVRTPAHACIAQLPADELRAVHEGLLADEERVLPHLRLNRATWRQEIDRIGGWAAAATEGAEASHTVVWFRSAGRGPTDDTAARAELTAECTEVGWADIDGDDVIREAQFPFLDDEALVGRPFRDLGVVVGERFGPMVDYEVRSTTDDRVDAWARFGETDVRITTVALRDASGWADRARLLVGVLPDGAN